MSTPTNLRFLDSHEWIETAKDPLAVGISDHAQSELSDVVYVELPELGRILEAGEAAAVVESVKAASDIYAPIGGEVIEVNEALTAEPGTINADAFGDGWLFKLKPSDPSELDKLLTAKDYEKSLS